MGDGMGIDAIIALVGLLAPPAIDFAKKLFLKPEKDTPEATLSALATTKPEVMADYIKALAEQMKASLEFFNRDVTGAIAPWVANTRAMIRPAGTIISLLFLVAYASAALSGYKIDPTMKDTVDGVRWTCEGIASSWFGTRITVGK